LSVQASVTSSIFATETLDLPGSSSPTVKLDAFKLTQSYNADSTPAASAIVSFVVTLTAGAATINLVALPGTQGTLDATGLKIRDFWFRNRREDGSDNSNPVTITPGASNGYNIFGSASGLMTLQPGDVAHWTPMYAQTVASGDRNIDLAGTGTDSFQCVILLG